MKEIKLKTLVVLIWIEVMVEVQHKSQHKKIIRQLEKWTPTGHLTILKIVMILKDGNDINSAIFNVTLIL